MKRDDEHESLRIQDEWELVTETDMTAPSPYCEWCSPWPDRRDRRGRSRPFTLRVPNHFRETFVDRIDETVDWLGIAALGEDRCRDCGNKCRHQGRPQHRLLALYFALGQVLLDRGTRDLFPRTLHEQTVRRVLDLRHQGIMAGDVAGRLNRQEGLPPVKGRWDGGIVRAIERYAREKTR